MRQPLLPCSDSSMRSKNSMTCSRSTRTSTCPPTSWSASANASNDGLLVLGVDPGLADTGYGAATKGQMLKMVQSLLATRELPRSDDAIDALAIAICHHHSGRLRSVLSRAPAGIPG